MSGHGHVTPNPNGTRARCGGPGICAVCSLEAYNANITGRVADVISEFTSAIPPHLESMPSISSNGVTRNEMEWKNIAKALAAEVVRLRKRLENDQK